MAFNFDHTPLGAVGNLAARAGRNQARKAESEFALAARGQNLSDARARDQLRAQKQQSERGFRLQMAESGRQDRRLNMQAQSMQAGSEQFQEARKFRDDSLSDWESIKDKLQPGEYARGLIAIRAGKIPPQLASAQAKMQTFDKDLNRLRQLQMAASSYGETLKGHYRGKDGKTWYKNIDWYPDEKITDPTASAALDAAAEAMGSIKQMQKLAKQMFEEKTQDGDQGSQPRELTGEQKIRRDVRREVDGLSDASKEKAYKVIEIYGAEEYLRMKKEQDARDDANQENQRINQAAAMATGTWSPPPPKQPPEPEFSRAFKL